MAKKRMFSLDVVDTDLFLDMPQSARLLYYDLGMRADEKGNLNNVLSIIRFIRCEKSDLEILILKGYIRKLENNFFQVLHWEENNTLSEIKKKRISYKYRKWRESVLKRDINSCQICGKSEKVMHVHHRKSFSEFPELALELDNGQTLCEGCHRKLHGLEKKVR